MTQRATCWLFHRLQMRRRVQFLLKLPINYLTHPNRLLLIRRLALYHGLSDARGRHGDTERQTGCHSDRHKERERGCCGNSLFLLSFNFWLMTITALWMYWSLKINIDEYWLLSTSWTVWMYWSLQICADHLVLVVGEQYGRSVELAERVFGVDPDRSVQSL